MIVMKFGGSSISSPGRILSAISLVGRELDRNPLVVVSAHGKTTDALIRAADAALAGTVDTTEVEKLHMELTEELEVDRRTVEPLLDQLSQLLHGVSLLGELTPRTIDHVMSFGERMSTRVMAAAMATEGIPATAVNAWDLGLITTATHGGATPVPGIGSRIRDEVSRLTLVPVITGFLGKDSKGNVTTLGRSGSDYTASIIGAAIEAEEVQIWTDVDGVMTCDPSLDDRAQNLPVLSFDEASELAYYGAQVLHPSTLVPAIHKEVPVRVLNTARPLEPGTKIVAHPVIGSRLAKSVVYKENVSLLTISSPRLMSAAQMLSRSLVILAEHGVGIHMANTSEASVSMVTDKSYPTGIIEPAVAALRKIGKVDLQDDQAIICVIGEELRGRAGGAGRIFGAVEERGIKPRMISQSSSEINVAFLVPDAQIAPAVHSLHELILESSNS